MEDYEDPQLVGAVSTGREPIYEVFDQSDQRIRIRHGDHHDQYIDVFKSAVLSPLGGSGVNLCWSLR